VTGWTPLQSPLGAFVKSPLDARETFIPEAPLMAHICMVLDHSSAGSWTPGAERVYVEAGQEWQAMLDACESDPLVSIVLCNLGIATDPVSWFPASPPGYGLWPRMVEHRLSNNTAVANSVTVDDLIAAYNAGLALASDSQEIGAVRLRFLVGLSHANSWNCTEGLHGGECNVFRNFMSFLGAITSYSVDGWHGMTYQPTGLALSYDSLLGYIYTQDDWPAQTVRAFTNHPFCG